MLNKIYHGDALEVMRQWPAECVDMCVTSPPYWGLRDYGIDGQLGLEKTPEEYIEKLVAIFREVRRVLRPWGTVWLNLGDSYASGKGSCFNPGGGESSLGQKRKGDGAHPLHRGNVSDLHLSGLKPKDLCMMPARVALALQADGWWLRSDIIWAKPNPMPESVTDRPTSSYEHIFLLTKSAKYFYDAEAVREENTNSGRWGAYTGTATATAQEIKGKHGKTSGIKCHLSKEEYEAKYYRNGRNLRNVWTITTQAYPEAHYATFPEELPRRCILAGTSAKGNCKECGRPRVRAIESKSNYEKREAAHAPNSKPTKVDSSGWRPPTKTDKGWQPSCKCGADTVPAVVLDPFFGSGTVGVVAEKLQRDWIGIEISREYIEEQAKKRTGLSTSAELVKDKPLFAEAENAK